MGAASSSDPVRSGGDVTRPSIDWALTSGTRPISYAEFFPDRGNHKGTVILLHGGGHSSRCYIETPDGRPGWAKDFVRNGYRAIVLDWPGTGANRNLADHSVSGDQVCRAFGRLIEYLGTEVHLLTHSMSGAYGWKLIETHGPSILSVIAIAPGPPGNIQQVIEANRVDGDVLTIGEEPNTWRLSLSAEIEIDDHMLERKLIGDSSLFPRGSLAAYRRTLERVGARLIYERLNIGGAQLRVTEFEHFVGKPILVVTGEHDIDHSFETDHRLSEWLVDRQAAATHWYLPDRGMNGNGHMMMLEGNSGAIADEICDWLDSNQRQ